MSSYHPNINNEAFICASKKKSPATLCSFPILCHPLIFFPWGKKKKAVKDGPQALLAALPHPHRRASADSDKTAFAQGQRPWLLRH